MKFPKKNLGKLKIRLPTESYVARNLTVTGKIMYYQKITRKNVLVAFTHRLTIITGTLRFLKKFSLCLFDVTKKL